MNSVYILQSIKYGRYYIGSTNDLERRLLEHNSGKTKSLKHLAPLRVVFQKIYSTISEARLMEKKLKKLKNRDIIERIITDGEIRMSL